MALQRYIIGIDLGTTNCAVAYTDPLDGQGNSPEIRVFPVPQIVNPGQVEEKNLLPSFSYQVASDEFPEGSLNLPWEQEPGCVVGTFARERGTEVPHRVISSSKSWLSTMGVDRTAPLLPWGSDKDVPHISPIEASIVP